MIWFRGRTTGVRADEAIGPVVQSRKPNGLYAGQSVGAEDVRSWGGTLG
jgi:hypothetical protein